MYILHPQEIVTVYLFAVGNIKRHTRYDDSIQTNLFWFVHLFSNLERGQVAVRLGVVAVHGYRDLECLPPPPKVLQR